MNRQIASFQKNGYIVIKNFFNPIQTTQILSTANNMINWKDTKNKWLKYYEDINNINHDVSVHYLFYGSVDENKNYKIAFKGSKSGLFTDRMVEFS